ncbi:MAG: DUF177 domain-containing protein [Pseudomonadota bacterium]
MTKPADVTGPIRVADLPKRRAYSFVWAPDADTREALARTLGVNDLRKLRFSGTLTAVGRSDWQLEAELGATVVQSCVATGTPVVTRLDEDVRRMFLADWAAQQPSDTESEMPEDDSAEPLGPEIDVSQVAEEALTLALPDFPRAPDAPPADLTAAPPDAAPLSDAETRPFAALAGLKRKLEDGE